MQQSVLKLMQLFAIAIVLLFIAPTCTKQQTIPSENQAINGENSSAKITDIAAANPFNRRIGAPVDGRTGDRWIANYKMKYGYNKSYTINNAYLLSILNHPGCIGISFHYAKDANDKTHILPIGVDVNGKIMKCLSVCTMYGNISWATAQQWIANSQETLKSHFFGSNTFDRLNSNPCQIIRVDYALNDQNKQQLLLSNPCGINVAKQYEDDSAACPNWCPSTK